MTRPGFDWDRRLVSSCQPGRDNTRVIIPSIESDQATTHFWNSPNSATTGPWCRRKDGPAARRAGLHPSHGQLEDTGGDLLWLAVKYVYGLGKGCAWRETHHHHLLSLGHEKSPRCRRGSRQTLTMRIGSQLLSFFAATTFLGSSLAAPQAVTSSSGTTVDATNANATAASAAEEALKQAALLLASMPDCGVSTTGCCIKSTWTGWQSTVQRNCLTEAIATSPCELTDLACSCSNATITAEVQVCILQSCTVKQSLSRPPPAFA